MQPFLPDTMGGMSSGAAPVSHSVKLKQSHENEAHLFVNESVLVYLLLPVNC